MLVVGRRPWCVGGRNGTEGAQVGILQEEEKPYEKVSKPPPATPLLYIGALILYCIRLLDSSTLPPIPSPTVRIKIYARLGYM